MTLPYLTSALPGTGGVLRSTNEDFFVDEELPYAPTGAGDHVFARIEKRGLNSAVAAQRLARALGVNDRDIGIAGMKDRHAVTRQWMSLPPPVTPEQVLAIEDPELTILEAVRHQHKLRTGHVRANRFVLRVRHAAPDAVARATAILEALCLAPGAPNWYGEQRFGRDGDNAARGKAIVTGQARLGRDRRLNRLLVSSLQSQLFNDWLTARLADGLYRTALAGDVLHKRGGGMFTCDDPATDTARLTAGELALTGPMFGSHMRQPTDGSPAAAREAQILAQHGLELAAFSSVRAIAEGTRRDATIEVRDARVAAIAADAPARNDATNDATNDARSHATNDVTFEVTFALPGGAYATAVMREIMKLPAEKIDVGPEAA